MTVNLSIDEWNRVIAILAGAPWQAANPLIMAIGEQLRQQSAPKPDGAGIEPEKTATRQ